MKVKASMGISLLRTLFIKQNIFLIITKSLGGGGGRGYSHTEG